MKLASSLLALVLAVLIAGCRDEPTQIIVSVDTNYAIDGPLKAIRYIVTNLDGPPDKQLRYDDYEGIGALDKSDDFPRTVALTSTHGKESRVRVVVEGYVSEQAADQGSSPLVRRVAIASFVRGKVLSLPMDIYEECAGDTLCKEAEGETCTVGPSCEKIERETLAPWSGDAPRISDAGSDDGTGGSDGGSDAADGGGDDGGTTSDDGGSGVTPDDGGTPPPGDDDVAGIALGMYHSCAWTYGGTAYCWGTNGPAGELVLGAASDELCVGLGAPGGERCGTTPRRVTVFDDELTPLKFTQLVAGDQFTCGLTTTRRVHCWGLDSDGQRGDGENAQSADYGPVVLGAAEAVLGDAVELVGTRRGACVRRDNGDVHCWGNNRESELGITTDAEGSGRPYAVKAQVTGALRLFGGVYNVCAQRANDVVCWGGNEGGQLAVLPSVEVKSAAPRVVLTESVSELSGGDGHICALRRDASDAAPLVCWGLGAGGQLGSQAPSSLPDRCDGAPCSLTPVEPSDIDGTPRDVIAGEFASCALTSDRHVACWGNNTYGQLGRAPSERNGSQSPLLVPGPEGPLDGVQILPPYFFGHVCVRRGPREIWCWGQNAYGETGEAPDMDAITGAPLRVTLPAP